MQNAFAAFLTILDPANNSLQSKSMDLFTASEVIDCVLHSVSQLRSRDKFEELFGSVFDDFGSGNASQLENAPAAINPDQFRIKRRIVTPSSLNDYVVSDIIPRRVDNVADMKLELHEFMLV